MSFLKAIWDEFLGFWGFGNLLEILKSGKYEDLLTWHGITSALGPLIPLLLLIEIIRGAFFKRFKVIDYKLSFFTYVFNAVIGRLISFAMVGLCIGFFGIAYEPMSKLPQSESVKSYRHLSVASIFQD